MENTQNKEFNIGNVIREGWELTKVNIGFLIVYQILLFFIFWLFTNPKGGWGFIPVNFIGWILIILGKMGLVNSTLMLTRGLKPRFDQFYSNWRLLISWVVGGFLFAVMAVIGFALFIVPGLIVWAVFGLFPLFILDKGSGPIEALKQSAEATKGIRWHIFLLFLTCAALNILGLICFGIGLLITGPVTLIAIAVVYRKITGQSSESIQPSDILS